MSEHIIISIPNALPLTKKISTVNDKIGKWIGSLEKDFDVSCDGVRLAERKQLGQEQKLLYIVQRDVK